MQPGVPRLAGSTKLSATAVDRAIRTSSSSARTTPNGGHNPTNTIMAVAEGVEVIHSTVLGLGERAGNIPMEETAMALLTLYGVDTNPVDAVEASLRYDPAGQQSLVLVRRDLRLFRAIHVPGPF